MVKYLFERLGQLIITLILLTLITFVLIKLAPGDPVTRMFNPDEMYVNSSDVIEYQEQLGLNKSIISQYFYWLIDFVQLDFGKSYISNRPVIEEILVRLPNTFAIAVGALFVTMAISIPLGLMSAWHQNRWIDYVSRSISLIGISIPSFWLGLILIYIFSYKLNILPSMGNESWKNLILPSLTLGIAMSSVYTLMLRTSLLEIIGEDFIRSARARGIPESKVFFHHALKGASFSIVTLLGMSMGSLLGGALVIEIIFSFPGIGDLLVTAVSNRDYPVIQGCVAIIGFGVVIINLLIDLLYKLINPRIKVG